MEVSQRQTKRNNLFGLISAVLLICLLSAGLPIRALADEIITGVNKDGKISFIEYEFNLDTNTVDGALQIIKTGGSDSVVPIPSAQNPSLLIEPTKKGGEFCYDVGIQSKDLVIETSIRIDGTPNSEKRIFTVSDQTAGVYVVFGTIDASRQFVLCDGTVAGTLNAGRFYDITYVINNVTHKFDVIFDGKTVASGKTIPNAAFDSVRQFRFQIANINPSGEKIYINKLRAYAYNKVLTDQELEEMAVVKKVVAQPADARKKWATKADISTAMNGNILLYTGASKARVGDEIKSIDEENSNAKPFYLNDTVMVPLRFSAENLGAKVEYNSDDRINIIYKQKNITFKKDTKEYTVDGVSKTLPEASLEKDGIIYVPLCAFSDGFETNVFCDKVGYIGIGDTVDEFDMRDSDFQNVLWEAIRPVIFEIPTTDKIIADFKNTASNVHPRVVLTSKRLSEMRELIKTDPVMKKWYELLIQKADLQLKKANCVYGRTDGTRMLDTCREAEERIRETALAYLLSGQSKYKDRAIKEMLSVCTFPDWNPYHFLDPSEMVVGVALGYDWLYDELTVSQRKTIEEAIKKFALEEVLIDYAGATGSQRTWRWCQRYQADGTLNSNYPQNWVAVCGGGMTVAALAVADVYPDLMAEVITKAMPTISDLLYVYSPDGANYDGSTYWELSCRYLAYMSSALTTACGTDYGMMDLPGVEGLMYFDDSLTMPTGLINFDYATEDSNPNAGHILWFAQRLAKPELTNFYMNSSRVDVKNSLSLPAMIWYNPAEYDPSYTKKRAEIYTRGVEIVNLTTQGYGADDMSVGFMGRPAGFGQQHAGSFILDALGVRWSRDPGTTVESYFTNPQMDRTAYYNQRPEGHSTIVINPQYGNNQNLYETAYMENAEWGTTKRFAICNMTKSYEFLGAKSVRRGIMLDNSRQYAHIRDEVKSDEPMDFYWFMQLEETVDAEISQDGKVALLTSEGKKFALEILTEGDYKFYVTGADPLEESPHPTDRISPGNAKRLNLHIEEMSEINLDIGMMPLAGNQVRPDYKPEILALDKWEVDTEATDLPTVKRIYTNGEPVEGFDPDTFSYELALGNPDQIKTLAVDCDDSYDVEIIQPVTIGDEAAVGKITVIDKNNPNARRIYYCTYTKTATANSGNTIFGPVAALPFVEEFEDLTITQDGTMSFDDLKSRTDLDATPDKLYTLGDLMLDNYLGSVTKPGWDENCGGIAVFDGTPTQPWSAFINVPLAQAYRISTAIRKSGDVVRTCIQLKNTDDANSGVVFESDRNILVAGTDTGLDWQDNVWYNVDYYISNKYKKIVAFITDTSTGVTSRYEADDYFTAISENFAQISISANGSAAGGIVEVGYLKVDKADGFSFDANTPVTMEYDDKYIQKGFNNGTWTVNTPIISTVTNSAYVKFDKPFPRTGKVTLDVETTGGGKRHIKLSDYDGSSETPLSQKLVLFNCGNNATSAGAILTCGNAGTSSKIVGEDQSGNEIRKTVFTSRGGWVASDATWMENTLTPVKYRVVMQISFDEAQDYYVETDDKTQNGNIIWAPSETIKVCPTTITFYRNDVKLGSGTSINLVLDTSQMNAVDITTEYSAFSGGSKNTTLTKVSYKTDNNWGKISMDAPFNGETSVQLDSNVVINVDDMDVSDLTLEVADIAGETTASESEASGNKIIFNPADDLAPDTTYNVTLKKAGTTVYTGTFKTMAENDIKNSIVTAPNADKTTYTVRKPFKLIKSDATACLIVATYDGDDKITDCKISSYTGTTAYGDLTTEVKDGATIKAFLWKNLDSIKPIEAFEYIKKFK